MNDEEIRAELGGFSNIGKVVAAIYGRILALETVVHSDAARSDAARSDAVHPAATQPQPTPSDWDHSDTNLGPMWRCKCNALHVVITDHCKDCRAKRPERDKSWRFDDANQSSSSSAAISLGSWTDAPENDWRCGCEAVINRYKAVCLICQYRRPKLTIRRTGNWNSDRSGWQCLCDGYYGPIPNARSLACCNICGTHRPAVETGKWVDADQRSGWECKCVWSDSNNLNSEDAEYCLKCNTNRPEFFDINHESKLCEKLRIALNERSSFAEKHAGVAGDLAKLRSDFADQVSTIEKLRREKETLAEDVQHLRDDLAKELAESKEVAQELGVRCTELTTARVESALWKKSAESWKAKYEEVSSLLSQSHFKESSLSTDLALAKQQLKDEDGARLKARGPAIEGLVKELAEARAESIPMQNMGNAQKSIIRARDADITRLRKQIVNLQEDNEEFRAALPKYGTWSPSRAWWECACDPSENTDNVSYTSRQPKEKACGSCGSMRPPEPTTLAVAGTWDKYELVWFCNCTSVGLHHSNILRCDDCGFSRPQFALKQVPT